MQAFLFHAQILSLFSLIGLSVSLFPLQLFHFPQQSSSSFFFFFFFPFLSETPFSILSFSFPDDHTSIDKLITDHSTTFPSMGSCVSLHRNSDSAMKFRLSLPSKTNDMAIPPSPIKHINTPINGSVFLKSHTSPSHFGSKDEAFFDSRGWLDSDCEDDFYSVNGDFTPSRGNTPVHSSFSSGTPRINQVHVIDDRTLVTIPEPSPTGKKKLADLFRESSRNGTDIPAKQTLNELALQSNPETPYMSGKNSVCSSERTPNGDVGIEKERPFGSVQCCLPSLGSCHSFGGDRRKKASPAIAV